MAVAVVLLDCPAHADRAAVLVEVTDLAGLELGDARAAFIDHKQRENIFASNRVRDALDVLS